MALSAPTITPALSTFGGCPASVNNFAICAFIEFINKAPPTVEPGATGVSKFGTYTIASPTGAPVSRIISEKSPNFKPSWRFEILASE